MREADPAPAPSRSPPVPPSIPVAPLGAQALQPVGNRSGQGAETALAHLLSDALRKSEAAAGAR